MASKTPPQVTDNSSDSSTAVSSSSSDSDRPRTSPPSSPIHRKTNRRSTAAASKIPRLRATSFTSRPFSPPRTPIETAKTEPLDWGSAGEWRRLSGSTKQDSAEMHSDLDEGGALLAERSNDGQLGSTSTSTMAQFVPAQLDTVSCGLFGGDDSNLSDLEHLEQLSSQGESEEGIDGDNTHLVSASSDLEQTLDEQGTTQAGIVLQTESPHVESSHSSAPGKSAELLPPATIRGPFLNIAMKELSAVDGSRSATTSEPDEKSGRTIREPSSDIAKDSTPSPQAILRGLIRDAHQHMMYFTLAHSHFSIDDLKNGLDYAYSMLQAATSKLALLRVLRHDTVHLKTAELRCWIERVDRLDDPLISYEPRMSVIFESVSSEEMKLALAELVQSRGVVEDEVKQTRALLMERVAAGERSFQEEETSSDDGSVDDGEEVETIMLTGEVPDAYDSWETFATVTMLVTLGLLYLCVRE